MKYERNRNKGVTHIPKSLPPSIPSKKVSTQAYTGNKTDTVGPALYNPKLDMSRVQARQNNFHTSKQTRKVFEPSISITNKTLPPKENPGPTHYDNVDKSQAKQFNAMGNTTNFLSKVPNCKDSKTPNQEIPGPGSYIKVPMNPDQNSVMSSVGSGA